MNKKVFPYVLLIPMLIMFLTFIVYPIVLTIYGSIIDNNGAFTGSENYHKLITDKTFIKSIYNTVIILLFYLIMKFPLTILIASILNDVQKKKKMFLTILFIPTTIGLFAYGIIFRLLFSNDGLLNSFFGLFGVTVAFLDNGLLAKVVIAVALTFSTFGSMVLYLLISMNNNISKDVYEACEIDGANFIRKIRYITIPMIKPILKVFLLFAIIESISLIDIPYQLTSGGPSNETVTVGYYIYIQAIKYGDFSYASMISVVTVLIISIILFGPRTFRRGYNGENY